MTIENKIENKILDAIEQVVNYLWNDELESYETSGRPGNHIFKSLEILNQWSHQQRRGELENLDMNCLPREKAKSSLFDDADYISVYTREDAIADGVLIDITEQAKTMGFRFHTAITCNAWNSFIARSSDFGLSSERMLSRLLGCLKHDISRLKNKSAIEVFPVPCEIRRGVFEILKVKVIVAPGDNEEPCMTLLTEFED